MIKYKAIFKCIKGNKEVDRVELDPEDSREACKKAIIRHGVPFKDCDLCKIEIEAIDENQPQ